MRKYRQTLMNLYAFGTEMRLGITRPFSAFSIPPIPPVDSGFASLQQQASHEPR